MNVKRGRGAKHSQITKSLNPKSRHISLTYVLEDIKVLHQTRNIPEDFDYEAEKKNLTNSLSVLPLFVSLKHSFSIIVSFGIKYHEESFSEIKVENNFKILNWDEVIPKNPNEIVPLFKEVFKSDFMKQIIDMSISHTRGIQSSIVQDTPIAHIFVPVVDVNEVVKAFNDFALNPS